jgi:hypothetical protein
VKLQTGKSSAAASASAVPAALRAAAAGAPVLGGIAAPAHVVSGSQRDGSLQQEVLRQSLQQQPPTACGSATAVPGTTMLPQRILQLTAAASSGTKKQHRPQPAAVLPSEWGAATTGEPAAAKKRRISRFAAVREQDRCGHCKTCLNRAMKKVSVSYKHLGTSSCMMHGFSQGVLQGMLTWQVGLTRA